MRLATTLSVLSIFSWSLGNSMTLHLLNEVHRKNVDLLKFIEFSYDHKCLQVFSNGNNEVNRMQFGQNLTLVKIMPFIALKHRNITAEAQDYCQTFLIFAESMNEAMEIFQLDPDSNRQFFPFSKIYFYFMSENFNDSKTINSMVDVKNFLTRNALFGYMFEKIGFDRVVIRDLLTNDLKAPILSYTPSDLFHPMVDTSLAKDNFRISLFNCRPFTFYPENATYNRIIDGMDGTEFRFVREVTKNWNKTFIFRDFKRTKVAPYSKILDDLSSRSSDLAMCSVWLAEKSYSNYDLTTFYDHTCETIMVPKPKKLNEASAIYTALNAYVWLLFLCFFLLSSISLNFISKMEKHLYQRESKYVDFTWAVMETINTVTSHSVHRFPRHRQVPLQILLISWILFSVWIGIYYTTTYASRMTRPSYEKPIDTVNQFLDHGLYLCSNYFNVEPFKEWSASDNKDYRELSARTLIYGENVLERQRLFAERKCGIFATRAMRNYVFVSSRYDDLLGPLRLMDGCVTTHSSAFAFQKYSPYTKLFNWHIRRYQEYGIIQSWYSIFAEQQQRSVKRFEHYPEPDHLRQLNLVNVSGAFCLLSTGLLLSGILFVFELMKYERKLSMMENN